MTEPLEPVGPIIDMRLLRDVRVLLWTLTLIFVVALVVAIAMVEQNGDLASLIWFGVNLWMTVYCWRRALRFGRQSKVLERRLRRMMAEQLSREHWFPEP